MYSQIPQAPSFIPQPSYGDYGMAGQYVQEQPQHQDDPGMDWLDLAVIFSRIVQLGSVFAIGSTIAYVWPSTGAFITTIGCAIVLLIIGMALYTKGDQSWLLGIAMFAIVVGTANGLWPVITELFATHGVKLAALSVVIVVVIGFERFGTAKSKNQAKRNTAQTVYMPYQMYE